MRISYNWLKDYIDINIPPEKLADILTMSGLAVESVEKRKDDHIFDIEITSNRPDWLSYIGVARELASITGSKLKIPALDRHCEAAKRPKQSQKEIASSPSAPRNDSLRVSVKVEDKNLCPRYTARIIRNVKVGESPDWLKTRLEAMGLRPINNIVDITNFCLFEMGEPMHAFDLGKISAGEVIIRKAKSGEKIVVIDGAEKSLDSSTLVIADNSRPIAIAGIMGGVNTEVGPSTKNILLEAAFFDPVSVRRSARKLGLSTESSYRFERRVDPGNILYASDRAAGLISKLAGGEISELVDIGARKVKERIVELRHDRLNKILGIYIERANAKKILNALGLKTKSSSGDKLKLSVPGFRHDLNNEIDLIEEISRIYGYGKIPDTIPPIVKEANLISRETEVLNKIRSTLRALGMDEIMTYSFLSKKSVEMAKMPEKNIVEIKNPLTSEQEAMRPSLVSGMLNAISWNMNRKSHDLRLFEVGSVYLNDSPAKFIEEKRLSASIAGQISSGWLGPSRPCGFFDLKGIVETLLSELGIQYMAFKYADDTLFNRSECASIEVNKEFVGVLGRIDAGVLDNFDITDKVYILEISLDKIIKSAVLEKAFSQIPKYPSVWRDISIIASKEILNSDVVELIKNSGEPILKSINIVDKYAGKQIPDGKIGLTYRLEYQDLKKTLEEKDVLEVHAKVLRALEEKLGARLRF